MKTLIASALKHLRMAMHEMKSKQARAMPSNTSDNIVVDSAVFLSDAVS